jgi:hypothetical protein
MPGQANTISTTTATLIMMTRLIPASVSTGISVLEGVLGDDEGLRRPLSRQQ